LTAPVELESAIRGCCELSCGFAGGQRAIPAVFACNTCASIRPSVFVADHVSFSFP